jgi:CheY-like chemotaxis protein
MWTPTGLNDPTKSGVDWMENILVVDDEADILKLISENLLIRGYEVVEAKTAYEALDRLYERRPSLMLLDLKLPDLTGWELLRRIEEDPLIFSDFPVLIMTASITDANMDLRRYPNVEEILIKPFSTNNLVAAVKQSIHNH